MHNLEGNHVVRAGAQSYQYEHAIMGTSDENLVKSRGVPNR